MNTLLANLKKERKENNKEAILFFKSKTGHIEV